MGVVHVAELERAVALQDQVARALLHDRARARHGAEQREVVVRPQHAAVSRARVDVEPGERRVGSRVVERAGAEREPRRVRRREGDVGDRREAAACGERAGEARERVAEHHRAAAGVGGVRGDGPLAGRVLSPHDRRRAGVRGHHEVERRDLFARLLLVAVVDVQHERRRVPFRPHVERIDEALRRRVRPRRARGDGGEVRGRGGGSDENRIRAGGREVRAGRKPRPRGRHRREEVERDGRAGAEGEFVRRDRPVREDVQRRRAGRAAHAERERTDRLARAGQHEASAGRDHEVGAHRQHAPDAELAHAAVLDDRRAVPVLRREEPEAGVLGGVHRADCHALRHLARMAVRGRERAADRQHPVGRRAAAGAEYSPARADARRGEVGLDPVHVSVRALLGDAAVEEDVHLASRARAVLLQRVVAVDAAVEHVEVHGYVRTVLFDVEIRHVERAVRADRHLGMARIGQIAVRLAAEYHGGPGRVADAADVQLAAVHEDARVRAGIVAEADAAIVVYPQLAAVDLHERTRALPDGIAAGILRKKDVASRVDALVQVQDATVHDDARGRHLVRRSGGVAVAVADRRPVVEMHRAAVHLEDGALLLPAVRVRGVNRRAADPHGDGEAVVEVPGAGLHHHLAFEEREARHALRRAVAVRVRHVDAASVRLRESRAVARDPVRARAVERERAGTRLHEAALLPEELAGEREVVLDVERGRLLPAVEARDVAAEHAAVRSRVAERAGADEERAGAAERAERAVRDEARSFERAAHEVGVAQVRVGGRERDDAAGAVVHEHVARAAERGDGERHAVARRERPRPFAERGVGRLPDDLVLAEDERVALRVVRDVAAARERRRGGGGERLARHHVLEADVVAALPREKVVD